MLPVFVVALTISCRTKEQKQEVMVQDPHTYSVPSEAVVKHLTWKASIDFENKTIYKIKTSRTKDLYHTSDITGYILVRSSSNLHCRCIHGRFETILVMSR